MAIKLLVFEDNDLLRESLESLISLNTRLQLLGAFSHVLSIKEEVLRYKPDLLILDIEMPQMSGIDAVRKVRAFHASMPILMLTVFDDNKHVFEALQAGASGYLLKKHIATKLFDAIDEVVSGGAPMSPSVARMVISAMQTPLQGNDYQLTTREREILTELSRGNSYKLIAAQLAISLDTVRTHIKNIYEKLHVHSQTEAVSKAINEKLV